MIIAGGIGWGKTVMTVDENGNCERVAELLEYHDYGCMV